MIPILKLADCSPLTFRCAGDDETENGTGFSDGELEPLDEGSCARIKPPNRVECWCASACPSLAVIGLSTDEENGQLTSQMISMNDNLVRTSPALFFGTELCIATAEILLGKSRTLTCGGGHQEQIVCRHMHESLYIETIRTQRGIFRNWVNQLPHSRGGTNLESNDIGISISSGLRSQSSGVSMRRRVPDFLSHTMGTEEPIRPHSSGMVPLSVPWAFNQQVMTMAPSKFDSTRYLFNNEDRVKSSGGIKSQGRIIKSCCMRLEKCLSTAQVPTGSSGDSSNVWTSTWRDGYDEEDVSE